jgi:hypothetical protein
MCSRIEQSQQPDGTMTTYKITDLVNGGFKRVLHSINDRPAVVRADGQEDWYTDGILTKSCDTNNTMMWFDTHGNLDRTKGHPAVVFEDGTKRWCSHGKLHRVNGPAVERADGSKEWYSHGKPHREDGPAVERADGSKEWYSHGKLHREDGPAVERADGTQEWWVNGKRHRDGDLPAIVYANGTHEWWVNGVRTREDKWTKALRVTPFEERNPSYCVIC